MKKCLLATTMVLVLGIVSVGIFARYVPNPAEEPSKSAAISAKEMQAITSSLKMTASLHAAQNALLRNKISAVAVNRSTVLSSDDLFTHVIKDTGSITDQARSGRCWLFAGLNILRPGVIAKYKMKNFKLSQAYDQFWDKLERANRTFELAIALRNEKLDSRKNHIILTNPIGDGGDWNYVVALVDRYGVVPENIMPDSYSAAHTTMMNTLLSSLLRKGILAIRREAAKGASIKELRKTKVESLKNVYKILVLCLGQPPKTFKWRYKGKDGKVSALKSYTPESFYKNFVGGKLANYVAFVNYPGKPMDAMLKWSWNRDMADTPDMAAANVKSADLAAMAKKSILANEIPWFACNAAIQGDRKDGLWAQGVENYHDLFQIDFSMDKADMLASLNGAPDHAMALVGVDVENKKPVKWKVENSWGKKAGKKGYFTITQKWFNLHVYELIVNKSFVPASLLKITKKAPLVLPPWDPFS